MNDGTEPCADEEIIYRRVPTTWYSPATGLNLEAFAPHKIHDVTGLSVSRARYKSEEEAAKGRAGKSYYLAVLQVGDLRQHGIRVEPKPLPNDPGHAELPDLNSINRKAPRTEELQLLLVKLCREVKGPFTSAGQ